MIKRIVIIGGHIQALGLARQVAGLHIPVVLFIEDGFSVARFSNAVCKTVIFKEVGNLALLFKDYEDSSTMILPTSDEYVEYLAGHYNHLSEHFYLAIPKPQIVALFGNKRRTYRFAEELGVPHPKSWYPENMEDVVRIADEVNYPVIVKPAVMYSFHRLFGKKAFRCDSKEDIVAICLEISEKLPVNYLIIQEFLSGGPKNLYSYGVFAVDGEPKAWIMVNRIRQNPMDFGNSTTFAITCNIPAIEETARKILKNTQYTGLAEVEFMYDEKSGTYKFLEINTRAWKWHSISMGYGFGFLSEMICYINHEKRKFQPQYEPMAWTERLTDFAIIAKETLKGNMKVADAYKSYLRKKTNAVWTWRDPLPGIMYLLISPILYIKRY